MKHWLLSFALICFGSTANAAWESKLDLNPVVSPIMIRELNDGQWLAGVTKENVWHLDQDGKQRLHAGVFEAWNAEHGNASFGMLLGVDVPLSLSQGLYKLGESLGLSNAFKPAAYLASALSLDAVAGYRPFHSADVNGEFVYGVGFRMNIAFGVKELQKGL